MQDCCIEAQIGQGHRPHWLNYMDHLQLCLPLLRITWRVVYDIRGMAPKIHNYMQKRQKWIHCAPSAVSSSYTRQKWMHCGSKCQYILAAITLPHGSVKWFQSHQHIWSALRSDLSPTRGFTIVFHNYCKSRCCMSKSFKDLKISYDTTPNSDPA